MGEGWRTARVASRKAGESAAVILPREGPLLNVLHALTKRIGLTPATAEDWVVRMNRPRVGALVRWRFARWLAGAPERLDAYEDAKARLALADSLGSDFRMERAGVLARTTRRSGGRAWAGPALAGLATAALVASVGLWAALEARPPLRVFETGRGQLTEVALEDGSRLALDTDSRVEAWIGAEQRQVELVAGEAWLQVARDPTRPFVAQLGDRQVVVTGTQFVLRRLEGRSEVHLIEGAVRLRKAGALTVELRPGDLAVYSDGGPVSIVRRQGDPAAWRSRVLVFERRRASEVLAAASRYAERPLQLRAGARDPVVTAAVPIGEPSAVSAQLRALFADAEPTD